MPSLVYVHGFRSSSRSRKAMQLRDDLDRHRGECVDFDFVAPDLSVDPARAMVQLAACCRSVPARELTLVGSSLGGFYALVLAEQLGCRAVFLNPSIRPFDTLAGYLGPQANFHTGEVCEFHAEYLAVLHRMFVERPTHPERYLLIVETGDEVLDARQAVDYHAGARQIIVPGGDHELTSFPQHIAALRAFAVGPMAGVPSSPNSPTGAGFGENG
jgi:predicted esterase YcpF (UPF0227 family)